MEISLNVVLRGLPRLRWLLFVSCLLSGMVVTFVSLKAPSSRYKAAVSLELATLPFLFCHIEVFYFCTILRVLETQLITNLASDLLVLWLPLKTALVFASYFRGSSSPQFNQSYSEVHLIFFLFCLSSTPVTLCVAEKPSHVFFLFFSFFSPFLFSWPTPVPVPLTCWEPHGVKKLNRRPLKPLNLPVYQHL